MTTFAVTQIPGLRARLARIPPDRRRSLREHAGHSLRVACRLAGDATHEALRAWELGTSTPSAPYIGPYVEYLESLAAIARDHSADGETAA